MIRTVWLAIICVVLVSALAAGKALRTPADLAVAELSADETATDSRNGFAQDTLSKADRLEINYVRHGDSVSTCLAVNRASRTRRHSAQAAGGNQNHQPALARSECLFVIA